MLKVNSGTQADDPSRRRTSRLRHTLVSAGYVSTISVFSCCIFLMLKNIENEQETENTAKK